MVGTDRQWAFPLQNNAEPIYMARLRRPRRSACHGFSGISDAFKFDAFFGKLSGHLYPDGHILTA